MKKFLILNLCVFGFLSSVHAERVYKWCDAKGLTHYAIVVPADVDAEVIHFPLSTSPTARSKEVYSSHFHQQHFRSKRATYFIQVAGHDEERAGREYNRKYGAVARLKRLEAEKRKKKAQAEQLKRQQTWQQQQKAKREQMSAQRARLVAQCEAAHETDCENPVFLRKWFRKKYGTK